MTDLHHAAVLRRLAVLARRRALHPLPDGTTDEEAAAALDAGAEALGGPPAEASPPPPPAGLVRIHVDGAARGNPGPAGFGAILHPARDGPPIVHSAYLGEATNNVAEYRALVWALAEARRCGFEAVEVRSDSQLMVRQMCGVYRVRHPGLQALHAQAQALARGFRAFSIRHVPREENAEADALANQAIDAAQGVRGARRGGGRGEGT